MSMNQSQPGFSDQKSPVDSRPDPSWRSAVPSWPWLGSVLASTRFWFVLSLLVSVVYTYAGRHVMNPDGLSYVDIASSAASGHPSALMNEYWSPAYPALLSLAFVVARPTAEHEFAVVHFVNFLIFILTLVGFSFYLRHFLNLLEQREIAFENWRSCFVPLSFCTFLFFSLRFIGTDFVTPDLAVSAVVFLTAGIGCRLALPMPRRRDYIFLGVVLGTGYYVKAPMLPLGVIFLVLLFFLSPAQQTSRRRLWNSYRVTLFTALLLALPLVLALSARAGKLTFGESGRINYAWYVNGHLWADDVEHPAPNETPFHPAPRLLNVPLILQFDSPVSGTYPLWYDPSYWYRSIRPRFDFHQQVAAVVLNWPIFRMMILPQVTLIFGAVVLWLFLRFRRSDLRAPRLLHWHWSWPLSAACMYALVHVEPRFMAAFFILFWVAVYGSLLSRAGRVLAVSLCFAIVGLLALSLGSDLRKKSARIIDDFQNPVPPDYQVLGEGLLHLGLRSGDRLAVVGYGYDCYYARYDRLRVVAQIPNAGEFSQLDPPQLKMLVNRLASIGVNALVVPKVSNLPAGDYWKIIQLPKANQASVLLISPEHHGQ